MLTDKDGMPQESAWYLVAVAFVVYAVGMGLIFLTTFQLNWSTRDSRNLFGLGLIAPIVLSGVFALGVARRLSKPAAVFTIVGCGIGHLLGLFTGASYVTPSVLCFISGLVATVLGLLICGASGASIEAGKHREKPGDK